MGNLNDNKDIQTIVNNYDNLQMLEIIKYLTNVVINDIEYMNSESEEVAFDYMIDYNLGNNKYIMKEDLESLVSITDTIENVIEYNKE